MKKKNKRGRKKSFVPVFGGQSFSDFLPVAKRAGGGRSIPDDSIILSVVGVSGEGKVLAAKGKKQMPYMSFRFGKKVLKEAKFKIKTKGLSDGTRINPVFDNKMEHLFLAPAPIEKGGRKWTVHCTTANGASTVGILKVPWIHGCPITDRTEVGYGVTKDGGLLLKMERKWFNYLVA